MEFPWHGKSLWDNVLCGFGVAIVSAKAEFEDDGDAEAVISGRNGKLTGNLNKATCLIIPENVRGKRATLTHEV